MYPACNAHAAYCYLWPVWLQNIEGKTYKNQETAQPLMCYNDLLSKLDVYKEGHEQTYVLFFQ